MKLDSIRTKSCNTFMILTKLWYLKRKKTSFYNVSFLYMFSLWYNLLFFQRHRPLLGECVGSFASCFPVAFLEPEKNKFNRNSILFGVSGKISEFSLEAQGNHEMNLFCIPIFCDNCIYCFFIYWIKFYTMFNI